jgi:hypothetical protein
MSAHMRVSAAEYLRLPLRAHELLQGVPLHDVSAIDLPGGGEGRTLADIRALESTAAPNPLAKRLFAVRYFFGRVFGWDRRKIAVEESLVARLSERDRSASVVPPGTFQSSFLIVYQFADEALSEILNATVHGYVCTALVRSGSGYRFYLAVYVQPVSWITRPYLLAIEPMRWLLYPSMLRRIQRAWLAAYAGTGDRR